MRTLDFTPLYRATVGYDQIADLMDRVLTNDVSQSSYPPYNIEKTADDSYRISIAVAGFSAGELGVEVREHNLIVSGSKSADEANDRNFLHRGIATRAFERKFQLAEHVRVEAASHEDGMLHIDLRREIPEALKPRKIEIASSHSNGKAIEGSVS
ncbi:MAG: Hsp20 family protein [Aestuariivita sp.]|nr:Hsp20 family protein [Aestuariivita sp.]MCY4203421.1 Hsp20 family protein [Aestuariivita sp.]MCY4287248.1 Hsp20 family protein [Aestuariivita sp.]MCY4347477.1 Hsp20 family protein [Aestuariivita sp.]